MGYVFGGDTGTTYDDLQRKREIARMLAQQASAGGASNISEGLTQLGQGIMSAILQGQDKRATADYNAKFSPVASALLGGKASAPKSGTSQAASFKPYTGGGQPEIVSYITEAAKRRGIDPKVALAVANAEGLKADPREGWQSRVVKNGRRETSYGPYQLLVGGGLGDQFMKQTGLDPRDPNTVKQQIDFALDQAAKGGWGPWYGAKAIGLDNWSGINRGGPGVNIQPASAPPPNMLEDGTPAPMGTAMTGFPPQRPPMAPPTIEPASVPQSAAPAAMAPQAPMTAYQRMMAQSIAKGEAGGLQGPVGRQQMAAVMGQGGGVSPGILSALGLGGGSPAPQAPMSAAPNPNDPAVQQSMGKAAADTNAMSQEQIAAGAEQQLAQVPTEQLIALFNDPRANPQQRQFLQSMIERRMQEQDPSYQMGLEKQRLELEALKNPPPDKPKVTDDMAELAQINQERAAAGKPPLTTEEWITARAKAGASVNTVTVGGQQIQLPDPQKGYMWRLDPATGQPKLNADGLPEQVPIPGSPEAAAATKMESGGQQKRVRDNIMLEDISRSINQTEKASLPVTGLVGDWLKGVTPEGQNVAALLESIKGNISKDALQAMRDASPTGGALGSVTEKELAMLQAAYGSLLQSQSKDQFLYNLDRLRRVYTGVVNGEGEDQNMPRPHEGQWEVLRQQSAPAPTPTPEAPKGNQPGERKVPFNDKDPATWQAGDVILGYKFLGGDRRDRKNWVKVE